MPKRRSAGIVVSSLLLCKQRAPSLTGARSPRLRRRRGPSLTCPRSLPLRGQRGASLMAPLPLALGVELCGVGDCLIVVVRDVVLGDLICRGLPDAVVGHHII